MMEAGSRGNMLALQMQEGATNQECRQPLEAGEDKKTNSSLELPETSTALLTT